MTSVLLTTATTFDVQQVLRSFFTGIRPFLPLLLGLLILIIVMAAPIPGRGPGWFARRDPWRGFKFDARRTVLARAGGRCEAATFFVWGRCTDLANEVDHVYPWSKGGATIVSNGQALCARHNRSKSNLTPPWWYLLGLERRRRSYFPAGADVRVRAALSADDRLRRTTPK